MRAKKFFYLLVFFVSVLGLIEIFSYFPLLYWKTEVHQRFYAEKWKGLGHSFGRFGNEDGARGLFYKGQPIRIALFGSSVLAAEDVALDQTWPEIMKKRLGSDIHVDNFSIGWADRKATVQKMEELRGEGRYYDLVIVQHVFGKEHSLYAERQFSYSYRWMTPPGTIWRTPVLLKKWWARRLMYDPWIFSLAFAKPSSNGYDELIRRSENREFVYNRAFYQSRYVQERMIYKKVPLDPVIRKRVEIDADIAMTHAKEISKFQVWIPEVTLYAPDMHPEYFKKFLMIEPFWEVEGHYFKDPRVVYESFTNRRDAAKKVINEKHPEVVVIDYSEYLKPMLKSNPNLYNNEFHLSYVGHEVVAEFMSKELRPIIEKIRSEKN